MNAQVTTYIDEASPEQKKIMQLIRKLIHEALPGATEQYKWGRPVFRLNKDFAYLQTTKSHVNLGFFNFEKLDVPQNRLEGSGKSMRHVKLKTPDDIDTGVFKKWFKTSAE